MATKRVNHSPAFLRAAAINPEEALAYMFLSAFGMDLSKCTDMVTKAVTEENSAVLMMMLTAGVQIRGNVVFVGRDYANLREDYPELVISGERTQTDVYNFSALHVCGHIVAHLSNNKLALATLKKGGDCILGGEFPESEAGKINKEIRDRWSSDDTTAASTKIAALKDAKGQFITTFFNSIEGKKQTFIAEQAGDG